jgi:hypothetical protein
MPDKNNTLNTVKKYLLNTPTGIITGKVVKTIKDKVDPDPKMSVKEGPSIMSFKKGTQPNHYVTDSKNYSKPVK